MCVVIGHLRLAGVLLILLALAQPVFDWYFGWSAETARLSTFTRQVFQVHGFFIGVILLMMGLVSVFEAEALVEEDCPGAGGAGGDGGVLDFAGVRAVVLV